MLRGPIALGAIRTSSVLGLRLVLQAGTLLLLASTLGADGFGLYAGLGAMAVLLGSMANFGTHLTLLRDVSRASLDADVALRVALGTTAFCGPILLIVYIILSLVLFPIPNDAYWVVVLFGCAEVVFQPFLVVAAMERHGRGLVARSQILLIYPLLLRLLVILAVAWSAPQNPLLWYALGHLVTVMLVLGFVVQRMPVEWRHPFRWQVARRSHWRGLTGYALMNVSANGVAELDKMLAARLLPIDVAGIYSAASRIVGSLVVPVMGMILSAMPRLFRDGSASRIYLQYWLLALAGAYGIMAAVFMTLIAPWVESVLGVAYAGIGELICMLVFAIPAVCVRAAATNVLTTLERPWMRIGLELVGWLVIVVLAFVFVKSSESRGLVFSIICSEWLLAVGSVVLINMISVSSRKSSHGIKSK